MAIHLDVLLELKDRELRRDAERLRNDVGTQFQKNMDRIGQQSGIALASGFERTATPRVRKAMNAQAAAADSATLKYATLNTELVKHEAVTKRVATVTDEINRKRQSGNLDIETETKLTARLNRERVNEANILKRVTKARADYDSALRTFGDKQSALSDLTPSTSAVSGLAGSPIGKYVLPAGIAAAVPLLAQVTSVAASAAGSLFALPSVIGAVGAAFATAKIATAGFSDALDSMGDPEKFATALQGLAPNAQNAALAIKALADGPLKDLQRQAQDAFFDGVGGSLTQLTNAIGPSIQQLTTSIAGSFNAMFSGVAGQLMDPATQGALQNTFDHIAEAFKAMAPAAAPIAKALVQMMSAGSGALPMLAQGATNAANAFARMVDNATKSGDFQRILLSGMNALGGLASVVEHLVQAFFKLGPVGDRVLPAVVGSLNAIADMLPDIIALASNAAGGFKDWEPILKGVGKVFEWLNTPVGQFAQQVAAATNPIKMMVELLNSVRWFFDDDYRAGQSATAKAQDKLNQALQQAGMGLGGSQGGPFGMPVNPAAPVQIGTVHGGLGNAVGGITATGPSWRAPGSIFGSSDTKTTGSSSGYSGHVEDTHGSLVPNAEQLKRIVEQVFPGVTVGGYRSPDGFNEHSSGEALDIMVGGNQALGNQINQWLLQNAEAFGVEYDLWRQAQWDPSGSVKPMADRGSPTANHMDHVHARVKPGAPESGNYMPVGAQEWNFNGTKSVRVESFGDQAAQTMQQQFGAAIDPDFGMSKGLGGLIENAVKAIANIAFAPVFGALSGVTSAYGSAGPGSGLLGAFAPRQNALGQFPSSGATPGGFSTFPGAPTTPLAGGTIPAPSSSLYGGVSGAQSGPGSLGSTAAGASYSPGTPWNLPNATGSFATPSMGVPLGEGLPNSSGIGLSGGGLLGMAGQAASAAAGLAGGAFTGGGGGAAASAAAQIGIDLLNRGIGYGAQVAGIGVQGLMETFLPVESALADPTRGWLGRIVGGVAGVRPVAANIAGQQTAKDNPLNADQVDKRDKERIGAGAKTTNANTTINYESHGLNPDQNAETVGKLAQKSYAPAGGSR